jgi:hypothetical protein
MCYRFSCKKTDKSTFTTRSERFVLARSSLTHHQAAAPLRDIQTRNRSLTFLIAKTGEQKQG